MKFSDFVAHSEDYPAPAVLLGGLQQDVFYAYVDHTYLNGIVNFTRPLAGVLLERYDVLDRVKVQHTLDRFLKDGAWHPRLSELGDDVILLCRGPSALGERYLFWFDCDVSDCCVGRFWSADSDETVIADVRVWVESLCDRTQQGVVRRDEKGAGWERTTNWLDLPVEYLRRGGLSW